MQGGDDGKQPRRARERLRVYRRDTEDLPSEGAAPARGAEFRAWLREGLGLAHTQWDQDALPERAFEAALRARIEAQHEWQFENSWPGPSEQQAIGAPRLAERMHP